MGFLAAEPKALGTCVQVYTHLGETQPCGHTQTHTGCDMGPLPLRRLGWEPVAFSSLWGDIKASGEQALVSGRGSTCRRTACGAEAPLQLTGAGAGVTQPRGPGAQAALWFYCGYFPGTKGGPARCPVTQRKGRRPQ